MELEKQVVSLELAKKLKELGVKQESLFYWTTAYIGTSVRRAEDLDFDYPALHTSAFTVAELGEMLPEKLEGEYGGYWCETSKATLEDGNVYWYVDFIEQKPSGSNMSCFDENFAAATEADARAKMLIYLIENNLMTV